MLDSFLVSFRDPTTKDVIPNVLVDIQRHNLTPFTDPATTGYDYVVTWNALLTYPNHPTIHPDEDHEIITPLVKAAGHTARLFRARLLSAALSPRYSALFKEIGG